MWIKNMRFIGLVILLFSLCCSVSQSDEIEAQKKYQEANDYFMNTAEKNSSYDEAIKRFSNVVSEFPKTDTAAESLCQIAWIQFRRLENYVKAETMFKQLIEIYPNSTSVKTAINELCDIYTWRMGITDTQKLLEKFNDSIKFYENRYKTLDNSDDKNSALLRLAEIYTCCKSDKALVYYKELKNNDGTFYENHVDREAKLLEHDYSVSLHTLERYSFNIDTINLLYENNYSMETRLGVWILPTSIHKILDTLISMGTKDGVYKADNFQNEYCEVSPLTTHTDTSYVFAWKNAKLRTGNGSYFPTNNFFIQKSETNKYSSLLQKTSGYASPDIIINRKITRLSDTKEKITIYVQDKTHKISLRINFDKDITLDFTSPSPPAAFSRKDLLQWYIFDRNGYGYDVSNGKEFTFVIDVPKGENYYPETEVSYRETKHDNKNEETKNFQCQFADVNFDIQSENSFFIQDIENSVEVHYNLFSSRRINQKQ